MPRRPNFRALLAVTAWACSDPTPKPAPAVSSSADAQTDAHAGDVAGLADIVVPDAGPAKPSCPGGAGCPCSSPSECHQTGVCADDGASNTGKACAHPFGGGCAPGYVAFTADTGEGATVCVPAAPKLCSPCEKDDDCKATGGSGALCMDFGAVGHFCGIACPAAGCPAGYVCADATGSSGAKAKQCQASEQTPPLCLCSVAAVSAKLSTPCLVQNAVGSCGGVRSCGPGGLSACSGKAPTVESCNGQDDDCNGQTDEGPLCDDGNPCTAGDVCLAEVCKPGIAKGCDDQNDCTNDVCDIGSGKCVYVPTFGVACSDGDPCTQGEQCFAGICKGGVAQPCPCTNTADCEKQEDGDLCNGTLYCNPATNKCTVNPATVAVCPPTGNPCTVNACAPTVGKCEVANLPNTTACSDGLPWTEGDNCQAGKCEPGAATKLCASNADCGKYEDGNLCNGTLFCNKATGVCQVNPNTVVYCPTANDTACLANACWVTLGKCKMSAINELQPCDDGNLCTAGEACKFGVCLAGQGADKCLCKADADCAKFEDGDACNGTLFCNLAQQKCQVNPKTVVVCPSVNDGPCAVNVCVKAAGLCAMQATTGKVACDADGNDCTPVDLCVEGKCVADTTNICKCAQDSDCADDGDLCNGVPHCDKAKNVCIPNPKTVVACELAGDTTCVVTQCQAASGKCVKVNTSLPCSDGDACTVGDKCNGGTCLPGAVTACDDGNQCTTDACHPAKGCGFVGLADGVTCSSGNSCTGGEICKSGACVTDAAVPCTPAGMVLIPAGTFWMGCNATKDTVCSGSLDENPQHKVTLSAYYMDITEVTVAEYKKCYDAGKCGEPWGNGLGGYCNWDAVGKKAKPGHEQHAVNCIDWSESQKYCKWRGGQVDAANAGKYDLPTEAQWEMAARGSCEKNGSTASNDAQCKAAMRTYPWGEQPATCTYAVMNDGGVGCGANGTAAVGSKPSGDSPYGLKDMAGNALEWTRDWHSGTYYGSSPTKDPENTASNLFKVVRGGYFFDAAAPLRAGDRFQEGQTAFNGAIGLRCSRSYP